MPREMIQPLRNFLDSPIKRSWETFTSSGGRIEIYLRKAQRYIDQKMVNSLDIATMDAEYPGKGALTELLPEIEQLFRASKFDILYVENVMSFRLQVFFEKRHYIKIPSDLGSACYYLLK